MQRVLVTPRSLSVGGGHSSLDLLRKRGFEIITPAPGRTPSADELATSLQGCVGWIAGVEPVPDWVLDNASDLRVVSRNGSGIDNLPLESLKARGIKVRSAVGSNAHGVAELTLGLALSVLRNIPACDRGIRNGDWPRRRGRELSSLTVGVVGYGAIGREVARIFGVVGSSVITYDPMIAESATDIPAVSLDDLFSTADLVTFHCPAQSNGRPILGAEELDKTCKGVVFLNTARPSLIDATAMLNALNSGHVAGYATDVFDVEPPELSDLLRHERSILTSHIGAFTDESVVRASDAAIANLIEALGVCRS